MKSLMKQSTFLLFFLFLATILQAKVSLPQIFTNHMVLQREKPIKVWGWADSNEKITVSFNGKKYETITNANGEWLITMNPMPAGGPHKMDIRGKKDKIEFKDILIGDVWLCSGQSNMEWRVRNNVINMEEEIANGNYPKIRMITLEKTTSLSPQKDFKAEKDSWIVCTPETVGDFSSVAYFFGREIHKSQNIPIGLVNSSWGGTQIEPWTDDSSLSQIPYFKGIVDNMKEIAVNPDKENEVFDVQMKKWHKELNEIDPGFNKGVPAWASTNFNDGDWTTFKNPQAIQDEGFTMKNGIFWFRKEIQIPSSWANKELTINLGNIDDDDFTYFNGTQVGNISGYFANRNYKVPANLVKEGKAVVTVRVLDTGGLGGFTSKAEDMYIESPQGKISLAGNWKIKHVLEISKIAPMPQRNGAGHPAAIYNAMIYPFLQYNIKGAIWYQGEANTGRAYQYRDLLPLMINGWRNKFGYDFPFYIVQLANHMKSQEQPEESTWAELREAQSMALSLDNTGLAVAIDIGEADDIHPRNKQGVGLRLALAARAKTYGEKITYSGPQYHYHKIEGNKIKISFRHAKGLKTKNNEPIKGFTIAGVDHKFYWADAVIEGNDIVVSSPNVAFPIAVRYAWANNPICNLYNEADLPADPFRTDDWPGITQ